jgi:hypothetical protein
MKLRDGRKIVLPETTPLALISLNPFFALSSDFERFESKSSVVGEDDHLLIVEWVEDSPSESSSTFEHSECEQQDDTGEDEVMWVEPLAISVFVDGEKDDHKGTDGVFPALKGPVSEWVSRKMIDFGLYL